MPSVVNNFYEFGEFRLDPQTRVLRRRQEVVPLTPKAFDVLWLLAERDGRVVTKDELMRSVWSDSFVEESNLTQTVFMLRKALQESPDERYILTVQGRGYRFVAPVKEVPRIERKAAEGAATRDPQAVTPGFAAIVVPRDPARARSRFPKQSWIWLIAASTVVLITGLIASLHGAGSGRQAETSGRTMLAVLPFQNLTGDPTQEYLSDGLTEEMIARLGNVDPPHLGLIARTSVMHYKEHHDRARPNRT